MPTFPEYPERFTAEEPNTAILFDETHSKGLTYAKIDELSGRVRAYLEANGIGREDFVLIDLPRGVTPIIAMIGVWKSGAAWALVEDTYAPERIEYIRKDCGCKLVLDAAVRDNVLKTDSVSGHVSADPHDAAYAIYTSGTTGNPKGVLHEYGNLDRAMKNPYPLTTEQLYMVDYQFCTPTSTMYNLFSMMNVDKEAFDLKRLAEAMKTAIANHPALLTTLVQPFKIVGGRLYRVRIFETEKNGYVFFDVHHIMFDDTSLKVLMGDMGKAYMGLPLEKDYYYLMLQEREDITGSEFYEESRRYFEERFAGVEWSCYPEIDHQSRENEMGELITDLDIEQPVMSAVEKHYRISRNEFFISVAALAISIYNKKNDIKLSWIYNGREALTMMTSVGLLFRDLPIGIRLNDAATMRELFAERTRSGAERHRTQLLPVCRSA